MTACLRLCADVSEQLSSNTREVLHVAGAAQSAQNTTVDNQSEAGNGCAEGRRRESSSVCVYAMHTCLGASVVIHGLGCIGNGFIHIH